MTADVFDPYDDHPDVMALPLAEAAEQFRLHWTVKHREFVSRHSADLRSGKSTAASRKVTSDEWQRLTQIEELRLYRSAMADRQPGC